MIDFWQQTADELQLPPATVTCVVRAADQYDLPPGLVLSVMKVEGGVDGAVHRNSNGSYDYGLMQVNSIWLPKLAPMGITKDRLVHRTCDNVSVAAWILRQNLDASDHFWKGVGNYHSRNARANQDYQHKIATAARQLPESWQWWNPKSWNLKTLAARLPWKNRDGSIQDPGLSTPELAMASSPIAGAPEAFGASDASSTTGTTRVRYTIEPGASTPIPAPLQPSTRSSLQASAFSVTSTPGAARSNKAGHTSRWAWAHGGGWNPLAWGIGEGRSLAMNGPLPSADR